MDQSKHPSIIDADNTNTEKVKILLIEDEQILVNAIRDELESNNFDVYVAYDGEVSKRYFENYTFSLILLDLNLPRIGGFELTKYFRSKNPKIPIIITTAYTDIDSKMNAFELGADDYLSKPFNLKEMLAKVKVFLKRSQGSEEDTSIIKIEDLEIHPVDKRVIRGGKDINLTPREFNLLEFMAKKAGKILSKEEIINNVWDIKFNPGTNTVEVYISFLRNKIDKDFAIKLIKTKPGFGYYIKG